MTELLSRDERDPAPLDVVRRRRPRPSPAVPVRASSPSHLTWSRRYVGQLLVTDSLSALAGISIGWWVRFGDVDPQTLRSYLVFSAALVVGWLICLQVTGAYEIRRISAGTREYQRVARAGLNLAGSTAIVAYLSHMLVARTFLALVIPIGVVLMITARYVGRKFVYVRRQKGEWSSTILAIGTSESVRHLAEVAARNPQAGLKVVGACVEDAEIGEEIAPGVPVLADTGAAADIADQLDVDVVAVAGSGLGPRRIRELGWALEGTGRHMVMAPGLTEVAGPRVHVSPVEGLPLMWVDQPQFTGTRRIVKRIVDIVGAASLLLLSAPLLLLIGLAVRLTSSGPALYKSTRMGKDGQQIRMIKFRSMYRDADQRRCELVGDNQSDGLLFKIRRDPRVTPLGRLIRKFSLDELPQLLNVLGGSMSLVGPRPPLPDEVERYDGHVRRRLLVKPGMTGLWQVSGRSDLTWAESVRLDLYYVENWSLGMDLAIIARTVLAVLRSRGAY